MVGIGMLLGWAGYSLGLFGWTMIRGYDVTLVGDAHTTEDQSEWGAPPPEQVIAHTNLYWRYQAAPGRTAEVTETKDVAFGG